MLCYCYIERAMGTQRNAIHCKLKGINDVFIKKMPFELSFEGTVNCSEMEEERKDIPA